MNAFTRFARHNIGDEDKLRGSMAGFVGRLEPFRDGENWREYVEIFEHFFIANDVTTDKKKVCILCSYVGSSTYHIIKTLCLPQKPEEKTFLDVCALVENHFKPKLSEASASLLFYSRNRKRAESVQMFLAELRRLAKPCNFGQFLERALRDRFIVGVSDPEIQQKILSVPDADLTLEKAYSIAESHEAAARNVREMQCSSADSSDSVMKMQHRSVDGRGQPSGQSHQERQCFRCAAMHSSQQCPFKDKNCFHCGRRGHTRKTCYKLQRGANQGANVKNIEGGVNVNEGESDDGLNACVHTVLSAVGGGDTKKVAPLLCEVVVNGQMILFEIDTGSPYTFMSHETLTKLPSSQKLEKKNISVKSFTGHSVHVLGVLNTDVTYKDKHVHAEILVTEHKHNLLGRDLIDKLELLTVRYVGEIDDDKLGQVIAKHPRLFGDGVGKLEGVQAKVHVDGDKAPIFFKPRSIPYAMRGKVEEELDRLLKDDVIEPVTVSDWAAPIVPVLKPNGQVRICGDYKVTVNRVSKLEQYPIPTLDDLLAKLGKGSIFDSHEKNVSLCNDQC